MKQLFFPLLILLAACNEANQVKPVRSPAQISYNAPVNINYDSCKKTILQLKQKNRGDWNALSQLKKEKLFTTAVTETIIPAWIGTAWDFNGTTETPQKGTIACGYFVTTVLRDAGLRIARTPLAQCASEKLITTLIQSRYIHRFSNIAIADFVQAVQQQGYGLYIVGLDSHVGFIYNDGRAVYFIHSTFVGTRNVQKEIAISSGVLALSKYKVLGKLSADENTLNKWMQL